MWQIYYPRHLPGDTCKVVTYVKTFIDRSVAIVNLLDHPMASASLMVLDVVTGEETLRLVNVYHCRDSLLFSSGQRRCYAPEPHFSFLFFSLNCPLVTSSPLPHHSAYYPLLTPFLTIYKA